MSFEAVIGLEIHVEMKTKSKLFSSSPNAFSHEPNTNIAPFDMAYPGTMLIVSHDRYLINKLADRIYYLQDDCLIESIGNYDDLLHTLEKRRARQEATAPEAAAAEAPSEGADAYRRRKEELSQARKHEKQLEKARDTVSRLEAEMDRLEGEMNDPEHAADYQLLMELQEKKDRAEAEYLAALEQLETLEKE